ncbi:type I methionyl aminopeptidase [Georgenia sp. Z1491]|uniref:type I methionyl aminopeptidase n=1 Tax=Georgenia sp. Z1491 TaxID=3416707 RepID=UPI003CEA14AF
MRGKIEYKTDDEIRSMRTPGLVVAAIHEAVRGAVSPGVTPVDLDDVAARVLHEHGARSNFLGYHGFPRHICVSVNDRVVHGIPDDRPLAPGDVVSVDAGAVVDGWHADAAFTTTVGEPVERDAHLVEATRRAMWAGVAAIARGGHVTDVGHAVRDEVEGYDAEHATSHDVVQDYIGHGIGTAMHMAPDVVNHRVRAPRYPVRPGLVVCVEPLLTVGAQDNTILDDDWTVVTLDGSRAAHWEHTVAVHSRGAWVLTAPDGGRSELAARGIDVVPLGA